MELYEQCSTVQNGEDLAKFLNMLANDFKENRADDNEWQNTSIDDFLESIAGWIEDNNSPLSLDRIEWTPQKAQEIAKLFYMGKIYE